MERSHSRLNRRHLYILYTLASALSPMLAFRIMFLGGRFDAAEGVAERQQVFILISPCIPVANLMTMLSSSKL